MLSFKHLELKYKARSTLSLINKVKRFFFSVHAQKYLVLGNAKTVVYTEGINVQPQVRYWNIAFGNYFHALCKVIADSAYGAIIKNRNSDVDFLHWYCKLILNKLASNFISSLQNV